MKIFTGGLWKMEFCEKGIAFYWASHDDTSGVIQMLNVSDVVQIHKGGHIFNVEGKAVDVSHELRAELHHHVKVFFPVNRFDLARAQRSFESTGLLLPKGVVFETQTQKLPQVTCTVERYRRIPGAKKFDVLEGGQNGS